jgi:hypothetical protein
MGSYRYSRVRELRAVVGGDSGLMGRILFTLELVTRLLNTLLIDTDLGPLLSLTTTSYR